jgi:hypothetical protein
LGYDYKLYGYNGDLIIIPAFIPRLKLVGFPAVVS